jgi:hypothetical protein
VARAEPLEAGEVREYQVDCAHGKRPLKVTIEEIDFVYDGVAHSLRFHWLFSILVPEGIAG